MKTPGSTRTFSETSIIAIVVFLSASGVSQERGQATPTMLFSSSHTNASCELGAAFAELADGLRKNADASGYIVVYSGPNDPPGLFHRHSLGAMRVMVNEEHIALSRIVIIKAGSREQFLTEYWLVPGGSPAPVSGPVWHPELRTAEPGKFDEFLAGFETAELPEYRKGSTRLDGFAQALRENPKRVGYIIGYSNGETATRAYFINRRGAVIDAIRKSRITGRQVARWAKNNLVELFNIKPARLIPVDGGYRTSETVELWIGEPGGDVPKPSPTRAKS